MNCQVNERLRSKSQNSIARKRQSRGGRNGEKLAAEGKLGEDDGRDPCFQYFWILHMNVTGVTWWGRGGSLGSCTSSGSFPPFLTWEMRHAGSSLAVPNLIFQSIVSTCGCITCALAAASGLGLSTECVGRWSSEGSWGANRRSQTQPSLWPRRDRTWEQTTGEWGGWWGVSQVLWRLSATGQLGCRTDHVGQMRLQIV